MFENKKTKRTVRGGKRTSLQREIDTKFCMDLYIKGYAIREIHSKLMMNLEDRGMQYRVSFQQVFNDIKASMIDWKKENSALVDKYVELELRKLDKMERELWDSWERSKNGKRKTEIEGGSLKDSSISGGQLKKRTIETGDGDPRYLDLLLKIYERRSKLLGYNAPANQDVVVETREENTEIQYDIKAVPSSILVDIAYKLQDAEYKRITEDEQDSEKEA